MIEGLGSLQARSPTQIPEALAQGAVEPRPLSF